MTPRHTIHALREARTRTDVRAILENLLEAIKPVNGSPVHEFGIGPHATHYDRHAAAFEAFARPLWGLASLTAVEPDLELAASWIQGLEKVNEIGEIRDRDQRMVECAPVGFAIVVGRLSERMSEDGKEQCAKWLTGLNSKDIPDTNWRWFRVFANLALLNLNIPSAPYSPSQLKADLDRLDSFYLSNGFSRDGPAGVKQIDYYSGSFAIQFEQLVYSAIRSKEDPVRCQEYRERATAYAQSFLHYVDRKGRPIPFGRSHIYRFAMVAFWSAMAFANVPPPSGLHWGHVKGIILRHLRWWLSQEEWLHEDGTMTIGYTYPNMNMTENYNSDGSPYWYGAMKIFACLAQGEEHPFWKEEELPSPFNDPTLNLPKVVELEEPSHIVVTDGNHSYLLSSGQACHYPLRAGSEKYGKFSYSAAFGYSVPVGDIGLEQKAADSMLAVCDADEEDDLNAGLLNTDNGKVVSGWESWKVRRVVKEERIKDGVLVGTWMPFRNTEILTILVPPPLDSDNNVLLPGWHLRIHRLRYIGSSGGGRRLKLADGAWAIHGRAEGEGRVLPYVSDISAQQGKLEKEGEAWARSKAGIVGIKDFSWDQAPPRQGVVVLADPNTNIMDARTVIPTLISMIDLRAGAEVWLTSAVYGRPEEEGVVDNKEFLERADALKLWAVEAQQRVRREL
ncbi:hypothetical protein BT69DRAFT_1219738 [Atractiella rhizophila]|nr:hypothetical protein BT69DRAFT_1219738 [Atractiella rhizophila]